MQTISSKLTSQNFVAGGFSQVEFDPNTTNLDWGGGRYDTASEWAKKERDVTNIVYDPFNRSDEENKKALACNPDTITCFNVFNVIDSDEEIEAIIKQMLSYNVPIHITIYEGKGDGIGRKTTRGYQRNLNRVEFHGLIIKCTPHVGFGVNVERRGKVITIRPTV